MILGIGSAKVVAVKDGLKSVWGEGREIDLFKPTRIVSVTAGI